MHHFYAYLSRMKYIARWGLMRNTQPENIQEHSLRVAVIAHALALYRNRIGAGGVDPARVALLGMFHDASEVITGDLPTPVKYFNPGIREVYGEVEAKAQEKLLALLPPVLREAYEDLFQPAAAEAVAWRLVKAADKICALAKCVEERRAGNAEFLKAEKTLAATVAAINLPEVKAFMRDCFPSFELTLDELE